MLRAGLAVCYGVFTPSGISLAPWVGTGRADVGVSGITPRGESKPQHPARLAKVEAVDGESDGQRKMGGAAEECPNQQAPVLETFATKNAETDIRMKERHEVSPVQ